MISLIFRDVLNTDLKVSSICIGGGGVISVEDNQRYCNDILDKYIKLGGNFIDTANIYGKWLPRGENVSEQNIGAWMKERGNRHEIILGTKGGHPNLTTMNSSRLSKAEVTSDLEESLKALKTDYIDLYWLHRDDERKHVGEILEYLNEFVKEGKIRYFGCSNWKVDRIYEAIEYSRKKGIMGFVANQLMWSLAVPNKEAMLDKSMICMDKKGIELHKNSKLMVMAYASQANGFYTKLERLENESMNGGIKSLYYNIENLNRFERIIKLSKELSRTVSEIVLAYLTSQEFLTVPIIGCRTELQLENSMSAGNLILDKTMVDFLAGESYH